MKDLKVFSFTKCVNLLFFCTLLSYVAAISQKPDKTIEINLNETRSEGNTELYNVYLNMTNSSSYEFTFTDKEYKNISFIIFQAHTFIHNVTLSYGGNEYGQFVEGTNIGLYSPVKPTISNFFLTNTNDMEVLVFVSIHGYTSEDPVPGGCNMEFPVPESPYLLLESTKDYVIVKGSPSKYNISTTECAQYMEYEFYMKFLPERDFTEKTYFDSLNKMLVMDKIEDHGIRIPKVGNAWNLRRMLSAYPGTGTIYVMVTINDKGHYSVYVPTHTYSCEPQDPNACVLLDDVFSQLVCALLMFFGIFLCYFGHRFFKTEMFFVGMMSGGIITYIILALVSELDRPALISASLLSGIFFGAIWLMFWWFYGYPVFAVMLAAVNLGFLVACIVYNRLPGGIEALEINYNFWITFALVIIITCFTLISMTYIGNLICCSVLGAYAIIYPIDYYLGTNLKYLVINTVRRAVVPKFNKAVVMPPFEWSDALLTTTWIALALTGFLFQHYNNRGKPPFPPPPRSVGPRVPLSEVFSRTYGSISTTLFVRQPNVGRQANGNASSETQTLLA